MTAGDVRCFRYLFMSAETGLDVEAWIRMGERRKKRENAGLGTETDTLYGVGDVRDGGWIVSIN